MKASEQGIRWLQKNPIVVVFFFFFGLKLDGSNRVGVSFTPNLADLLRSEASGSSRELNEREGAKRGEIRED